MTTPSRNNTYAQDYDRTTRDRPVRRVQFAPEPDRAVFNSELPVANCLGTAVKSGEKSIQIQVLDTLGLSDGTGLAVDNDSVVHRTLKPENIILDCGDAQSATCTVTCTPSISTQKPTTIVKVLEAIRHILLLPYAEPFLTRVPLRRQVTNGFKAGFGCQHGCRAIPQDKWGDELCTDCLRFVRPLVQTTELDERSRKCIPLRWQCGDAPRGTWLEWIDRGDQSIW